MSMIYIYGTCVCVYDCECECVEKENESVCARDDSVKKNTFTTLIILNAQ